LVIEEDEHLLAVLRYVERNALHAEAGEAPDAVPVALSKHWTSFVNRPETEDKLERLRRSVVRGAPFGDVEWQRRPAERLGLQSTLAPRGRPRVRPIDDPNKTLDPFNIFIGTACLRGVFFDFCREETVSAGNESWSERAIRRLGLESTLRPRGRPKKQAEKGS
jgi:hypothetical protein